MNYTEEKLSSISEAIEDKAFAAKVKGAHSADEIKTLFLDKGIEVDDEFARGAYEKIAYLENGGKLTEEELELVAGGKKTRFSAWLTCVGASAAGGAIAGPGGAVAGAIVGTVLYWFF